MAEDARAARRGVPGPTLAVEDARTVLARRDKLTVLRELPEAGRLVADPVPGPLAAALA